MEFNIKNIKFCAVFIIICGFVSHTTSASLEKDLTISYNEKQAIDKFRELMENRLPHEYMKKDIYLIRWLRARDFDIPAAEQMLLNNLKWREENKIDQILEEDFSDMEEEYKYYIETYERNGQTGVVLYGNIGDWNARKVVLQGKVDRALRYGDRYLEEITTKVRTLQEAGYNVSQYDFVLNMAGFNLITHGCLQCLSGITSFVMSYESHYPNASNKMFLINCPSTVEVLLKAVKRALSPITREALQIFGTNKAEWQPKVFDVIPQDYLPSDIGGNKIFDD